MKKREPKTEGLEFVRYSLVSFNGSGYADRNDAESFFESYLAYNKWKNRERHYELALLYRDEAMHTADYLVSQSEGASREPTQKNVEKFASFYAPAKDWV